MGHRFAAITFTKSVRRVQQAQGSRNAYARLDQGADYNQRLGDQEINFIKARDSFYIASVSETGWPYVQHRGGPSGFMRVIDEQTLGFADFSGNRQYISTGNFLHDNRVCLFFMDYPNKRRLKLLGRVRIVSTDEAELLSHLESDHYRAAVERGVLIHVEAFDWNCPQHITPRYTQARLDELLAPLLEENKNLKTKQDFVPEVTPNVLGEGPLELVITGIRQLTPRVRAYELRDANGADLPAIEAGAHLQVPVRLNTGEMTLRAYSICSNPARRDIYEIAVLREDKGRGGSIALQEQYRLGLTLRCELPKNHFQLHNDNRPAVLIAGGIGITPLKAIAQALTARNTSLQLHYAGRNQKEMAFRDRLQREIKHDLITYSAADNEHMDIKQILSTVPQDAVLYVCGPARLVYDVIHSAATLNIDPTRIRYERFSPAVGLNATAIQVTLQRSGKTLYVDAKQAILDALLAAGIDAPFSCRAGSCKSCAVKVLEGEPDHRDTALSTAERHQQQLMCPCVSRATGTHLTLDI